MSFLPFVVVLVLASGCSDGSGSNPSPDAGQDQGQADATQGAETALPTSADEMFAYLQANTYAELAAESDVHASSGPHGGVRTFINSQLAASLAAGNTSHPVGAGAIKELHGSGGVTGWAASVKIAADSENGNGWYWYEVFSTTDGSNPIEGNGNSICTGCHSAGEDFVLVPFPLQ